MSERPFWKELDAGAAFDEFVSMAARAVTDVTPMDIWLFLATCPACQAPLESSGLAPSITGFTVSYPSMVLLLAQQIKENAKDKLAPCARCGAGVPESAFYKAYTGRMRALTHCATIGIWDLPLAEPPKFEFQVFRPPDHWTNLGATATSEMAVREAGRIGHPMVAVIQVLRAVTPEKRRPVEWISSDSAVTPLYADPNDPNEQAAVRAAVTDAGLPGPHYFNVTMPGKMHPGFERMNAPKLYEELAGPLRAGIVYAFSLPRIEERIDDFVRTYGVKVDLDPPRMQATVVKGLKRKRVDLKDLLDSAPSLFATFDDMFHQAAFTEFEPLKTVAPQFAPAPPAPPMPPVGAATVARPANLQATPRYEATDAAVHLPPATPAAAPPPPLRMPMPRAAPMAAQPAAAPLPRFPWDRCQQCGAAAILVRRMYDPVRLDSLYKPKPALAFKSITVNIAVMVSCGQHLFPVMPTALAAWRMTPEQAADEAARALPFDTLRVKERYGSDKQGRSIIGFVGPFAASIATDPLWVENAVRRTGVEISGTMKVECNGENVITIRSKETISAGSLPRDLRKISKGWGLPEPMIGFTFTREFGRSAHAAGEVIIDGPV